MKKVIIVNNNLKIGGVQKSLLNLLKELVDSYEITLLLFSTDQEMLTNLPASIKVITTSLPFKFLGISSEESKQSIPLFLGRSLLAGITRIWGRRTAINLMLPFQTKLTGYDVAISYLHEGGPKKFYGGCNEFVLEKIDAQKKITWIHCDFGRCGANTVQSRNVYSKFDTIITCSEGAKTEFINCLPDMKSRTIAVRNCNDYNEIRRKATPAVNYDLEYFNIVTVARLSAEKGINRMLYAMKEAVKEGYRVKYHIVGAGREESTLKAMVRELGLIDNVCFYGNQQNPYPYMVNADLFALPSYHEAAPMVFDEAACLGVPILATKTTSTDEMILDEKAGFVCENTQEGIIEGLLYVLQNRDVLKSIKDGLAKHSFSNERSVSKLKELI